MNTCFFKIGTLHGNWDRHGIRLSQWFIPLELDGGEQCKVDEEETGESGGYSLPLLLTLLLPTLPPLTLLSPIVESFLTLSPPTSNLPQFSLSLQTSLRQLRSTPFPPLLPPLPLPLLLPLLLPSQPKLLLRRGFIGEYWPSMLGGGDEGLRDGEF